MEKMEHAMPYQMESGHTGQNRQAWKEMEPRYPETASSGTSKATFPPVAHTMEPMILRHVLTLRSLADFCAEVDG